jgi:hypothetical protein
MISYVGISIFIFGNKLENDKIELAKGVIEEFDISVSQNAIVLPIGATGYVSKELWEKVLENFDKYFPSLDLIDLFKELGNPTTSAETLITQIIKILKKLNLNG